MFGISRKMRMCAATVVACALPVVGQAATITGSFNASPGSSFNLTELGGADWGIWSAASGTPSNSKSGGNAISNVTFLGSGIARAVGPATASFSYTDGTSPTNFSGKPTNGVTDNTLRTTGHGVQFTVTNPTLSPMDVYVFVSGYEASSVNFTASLPGAASYVHTEASYGSDASKPSALYTLRFTPDAVDGVSNVLTVSYTFGTPMFAFGNGHVVLSAVAAEVVPEPASVALLGGLGLVMLRRRRPAGA